VAVAWVVGAASGRQRAADGGVVATLCTYLPICTCLQGSRLYLLSGRPSANEMAADTATIDPVPTMCGLGKTRTVTGPGFEDPAACPRITSFGRLSRLASFMLSWLLNVNT